VPLALYFAAALARLGDGKVVVQAWEGEPRDPDALLQEIDEDFDPSAVAWVDYPYALFLAAEDGDAAAVARLVAAGANLHVHDNRGVTPLMFALLHDNAAAAWELLKSGANPRAVNLFGMTTVEYASGCSDAWLREEIAARARFPHDELFELVVEGDSNGVIAALTDGAPVDARTPEGFTLLMAAVRAGDENLVDALLRRGASVALVTESGTSVLDVAEAVGNVALEKVLRAHGALHGRAR
jgi:ankyrin repeat protein